MDNITAGNELAERNGNMKELRMLKLHCEKCGAGRAAAPPISEGS